MQLCENCGKPATMLKSTGLGDVPTCDTCKPGDWNGDARPIVADRPDLTGKALLSKKDAAYVMGDVSLDYFEQHIMPALRTVRKGGRVLIPRDEIDAWIAANKGRALKDS